MAATWRKFLSKLGELEPASAFLKKNVKGFDKIDVGGKTLEQFGSEDQSVREGRLRRLLNAAAGGVGGAVTGGGKGAVLGLAHGYQDKRPATGRRMGQKALVGAGSGLLTRALGGLGSVGDSASSVPTAGVGGVTSGTAGSTVAGTGSSYTAGVDGVTSASGSTGVGGGDYSRLVKMMMQQNKGGQQQEDEVIPDIEWKRSRLPFRDSLYDKL